MILFGSLVRMEVRKLFSTRFVSIGAVLFFVLQPALCYFESRNIAHLGVHATPTAANGLAAPVPPLPYIGTDVFPFGEMVIAVIAALWGGSMFSRADLATTFLASGARRGMVGIKLLVLATVAALVSFLCGFFSMMASQGALGSQGLNPVMLSATAWGYLGKTALYWMALALMAYSLAAITKTWLVPLAIFVPLIFGLSDVLTHKWRLGDLLPVGAGHCLVALPGHACANTSGSTGFALMLWVTVCCTAAFVLLCRRDVSTR